MAPTVMKASTLLAVKMDLKQRAVKDMGPHGRACPVVRDNRPPQLQGVPSPAQGALRRHPCPPTQVGAATKTGAISQGGLSNDPDVKVLGRPLRRALGREQAQHIQDPIAAPPDRRPRRDSIPQARPPWLFDGNGLS